MKKNGYCGSCGHEKVDECYAKQCSCCLTDHQGAFGKNRQTNLPFCKFDEIQYKQCFIWID